MLDINGTSSQGRDELNLRLIEQVVIASGESGVRLLFDLEDDITRNDTRGLITFAAELDLGTRFDTTIHMDVKNLAINNSLLAHALLAAVLILEYLSFSVAIRADGLESLDHGAHLAHHRLHAVTVTACASPNRAFLAAATLAFRADDRALQRELGDLPPIDVLKRHVVSVEDCLGLLGATLMVHAAEHAAEATTEAATTEELGKEVLSGHAATAGAAF